MQRTNLQAVYEGAPVSSHPFLNFILSDFIPASLWIDLSPQGSDSCSISLEEELPLSP